VSTATLDNPRAWERQAMCAVDPDLFHSNVRIAAWGKVAEARHICLRHCPVREQCARAIGPMRGAVVGGVYYNADGEQSAYQPLATRCRLCTRDAR
jgi:hypothetical protein